MWILTFSFVDIVVPAMVLVYFGFIHFRCAKKLPPGPKGYPLIGNMFDMMASELWESAQRWASAYGNIIHLKSVGKSVVLINSYDIACELLERRSLNYSDRPKSVMLIELQHWDWSFSVINYGDVWKRLRTPMQKFFEPTSLVRFDSVLDNEAGKLLRELLRSPKEYDLCIRTAVASSIMILTYGHEITSFNDPFVTLAREGVDEISRSVRQGTYFVDMLPWLKHLPRWFPGAGFKAVAERGAKLSRDVQYVPFRDARDKILSGINVIQSFTSHQIDQCREFDGTLTEADEYHISAMGGISYLAGSDTSVSALMSFLLAMTLYPEIQKRAQSEIDQVMGGVRLPKLSDRDQLPYLIALCKEIQRWSPVLPLGVPHQSRGDDTYNGYFIPAKSILMPNHWAMLRDPEEYPDPSVFKPERFLPTKGERMQRDPAKVAFGFGRRICPGRFLAENTIFVMAAQILAVFDISKSLDDNGKVIAPDAKFSQDGVVRHPLPFECTITPRSREAAELIQME